MLKKKDISPLIKHGFVGGGCFILNLLIMWILVQFANISVLFATAICFIVVNAIGHHLSRHFIFYDTANQYQKTLLRFFLTMSLSFVLNITAMAIAVYLFKLHYLIASACIAALFFIGNFIIHRDWTFR